MAGAPEADSCPHGSDGRWFEVRSSRFSQLRTRNFELRIAPVALSPPVSPVSLILSSARFNPIEEGGEAGELVLSAEF